MSKQQGGEHTWAASMAEGEGVCQGSEEEASAGPPGAVELMGDLT